MYPLCDYTLCDLYDAVYISSSGKSHMQCCKEMGLSEKTSRDFRRGLVQGGSKAYAKWVQYLRAPAADFGIGIVPFEFCSGSMPTRKPQRQQMRPSGSKALDSVPIAIQAIAAAATQSVAKTTAFHSSQWGDGPVFLYDFLRHSYVY